MKCVEFSSTIVFQVSILTEQLDRQNRRLSDQEQLLAAKKELLRKTELALDRERQARTAMEKDLANGSGNNGYFETQHFRQRCAALEAENR